jgi:[protein-PII] uridylyltransferase
VANRARRSGATVRSASTNAESGNQAFLRFEVAPAFDVLPGWRQVGHDLTAALDGDLPLAGRLAERERGYVRRRALAPHPVRIRVIIDNDAATSSTVVEVRAPDQGPLLYHLALAISEAGFDIVSAMVSTLGAEAIDVFYVQAGRDPVTGTGGRKLAGEEQPGLAAALTAAVEALA